uniref:C3H1-type domain-containing protein n=1 Tax=Haemonchus contortus TaxID=6289 RepID=A0A7I4YL07_HAECO
MNNEINTPHGQHSPFSEHISPENSRNNSQLLPHSPPSRYSTIQQNSSPGNYQLRDGRHRSPITNTENHVGTPSPSRRPVGTFEYGHTYGSSTYRHDQTTFLGTPKLSTRYKPDNASFRQLSRPMHDNRRRQFSPFVHYPRFQEKPTQDENDERSTRKGPAPNSDDYRGRAFPVNHDWEESSTFQEPQQPKTYSACALTIWKVDEFCGFLCDKNALCTNLHFYADSTTVVEEDGKPLGELPSDRLQRGHRIVENSDTKGISSSNVTNGITPVKPTLEQGNCLIDSRKERDERVTNRKWDAKVEIIEREKNSQNSHEAPNTKKSYSPPRRIYRPIGYPAEANDPIPICMIENPRKRFRYGDEPPCRFTIPDEAERNHYAMYSSLYKSMEDFLLRHKHRREKNMRRSSRNVSATKSCELDREEIKKEDQFNTPSEDTTQRTTVDDSPKRFHFVGTGDDIGEIMASPKNCPKSPTKPSPSVKCSSDGWWYRRKRPRIYPTVVVAEFIEKRDVEKDCNEDVNVYRLPKTLTIRNSGVFVDDGICADSSGAMPNSRNSNPIISQNKDDQPSIMSLIQNDDVIGKFFAPLLKGPPKA